ncbi:dynactin subunit 6 [Cimex lectularius]|uniref:Dynactin subunit 6 n=1 Tax=Cimex lectularius TaxID=79782 RepID=A0A8I6S0I7_CIMLE|nr:dynactin subunit 6 [Cimex lectularius]
MTSHQGSVRLAQGAVVCLETKLVGNISIGPRSVIHPKASIIAEGGPVIMGENNIVEEQCIIEHKPKENDRPNTLMIGSHNIFEVGCNIKAKVIGDNNVFEAKCYVGPDIEVGNGCIIGAGVRLVYKEKLPDNVIITGSQYNRTIAGDRPPPQTLQLDFLTKVLPNYHHLRRLKDQRPNVL